jgi:hypothetical protein
VPGGQIEAWVVLQGMPLSQDPVTALQQIPVLRLVDKHAEAWHQPKVSFQHGLPLLAGLGGGGLVDLQQQDTGTARKLGVAWQQNPD